MALDVATIAPSAKIVNSNPRMIMVGTTSVMPVGDKMGTVTAAAHHSKSDQPANANIAQARAGGPRQW